MGRSVRRRGQIGNMKPEVLLDPHPAPHASKVAEALRSEWGASDAATATINLSSARQQRHCVEFLIDDGIEQFRLGLRRAGLGSAIAGCNRVRVLVVRLAPGSSVGELLGEAEIRISITRPWSNADEIARAAIALTRQGVASRKVGTPIDLRLAPRSRPGVRRTLSWLLGPFARSLWTSLKWRLGRQERQQWMIGALPRSSIRTEGPFPWQDVQWIEPPTDGIMADPCLVKDEDEHWLFYEHMLFTDTKATLYAARLDPRTGGLMAPQEVLSEPHHLSFPNVFRRDGDWFMLPEQGECGAVRLYRATSFPHAWAHYRDLLPSFPGLDPVLFWHDGKWWLFVTRSAAPCVDDNLHLFWSDSLSGEFVSHPLNPIKTGLFGSRMAGMIFEQDRQIIRPAQDGRNGYGHGLVLYAIETLTTTEYKEKPLRDWAPQTNGPFKYGLHALDVCGDYAVVDAQRMITHHSK